MCINSNKKIMYSVLTYVHALLCDAKCHWTSTPHRPYGEFCTYLVLNFVKFCMLLFVVYLMTLFQYLRLCSIDKFCMESWAGKPVNVTKFLEGQNSLRWLLFWLKEFQNIRGISYPRWRSLILRLFHGAVPIAEIMWCQYHVYVLIYISVAPPNYQIQFHQI
jgi:hypothetical protein